MTATELCPTCGAYWKCEHWGLLEFSNDELHTLDSVQLGTEVVPPLNKPLVVYRDSGTITFMEPMVIDERGRR